MEWGRMRSMPGKELRLNRRHVKYASDRVPIGRYEYAQHPPFSAVGQMGLLHHHLH